MKTEIKNIRDSIMGTVMFDLKAKGHRGFQSFIVYPVYGSVESITVQSDKRIGKYYPKKGIIKLSKSRSSGSYNVHLHTDDLVSVSLNEAENVNLRQSIGLSFDDNAGSNGVVNVDNSKAINLL